MYGLRTAFDSGKRGNDVLGMVVTQFWETWCRDSGKRGNDLLGMVVTKGL
jgi:hypothetical protein